MSSRRNNYKDLEVEINLMSQGEGQLGRQLSVTGAEGGRGRVRGDENKEVTTSKDAGVYCR